MATKAVWNWFFPKQIFVPKCVRELLEFTYPEVDWGRVTFHEGFPHVISASDKKAITLPHFLRLNRIQIFFKSGEWDPCTCDGLGLILHEGFHVLQTQDILNGWGLGLANATTLLYLACWAGNGFSYDDHPAEEAAYKVAGRSNSIFNKCCRMQRGLPCNCTCNPPSLDATALTNFENNCPDVVQESSGLSFWGQFADCTPGLETIGEWAKSAFNNTCRSDLNWGMRWAPCLFGLIVSGILWLIYGLWFAIWFIIWFIATLIVAILDLIVGILGAIVSGIIGLVEGLWNVISSPFSRSKGWLWFTNFNRSAWQVPDTRISENDHSRTGTSPSVAVFQTALYAAYRGHGSTHLWYNVFDGTNWLEEDIEITKNGRTRTSSSPSLAVYNNRLYMAYKGAGSDNLWYSVFDGTKWLDEDIKITKNGRTRTSSSPSLAVFNNQLYMAYKGSDSTDLWYNVFDGANWLDEDIKITKNGKTRTSGSPSLAVYDNQLYMAYKGASSDHIWYNVFDGANWLAEDIEITKDDRSRTDSGPSLAVFDNKLYMVYKGSESEDIWYNVFDGSDWLDEDCRITQEGNIRTATRPAAAEFNALLYLVYRGAS